MAYFSNKNAQIQRVRRNNRIADIRTENCINAVYDAYMMFALLALCEKCGFREKRIKTFTEAFTDMVVQYQNGELSQKSIKNKLSEYGIEFEPIQLRR